jgi:aspartyl-tRNA(Asn)/glutamyl-tRNA(Gln) amidotransferase subunit B
LIPVEIDEEWIEEIRQGLPELPDQKRRRFIDEFSLPEYDAVILTESKELADYFEAAVEVCPQPKKVSNWMMTELLRELKGAEIDQCLVMPNQLGSLLNMVEEGTISGKIAKTVFIDMLQSGKGPEQIVKEKNLVQVSDESQLLTLVREIIEQNPTQAEEFRGGKSKVMGYFIGQLMQKTKGKANPKLANQLFTRELLG